MSSIPADHPSSWNAQVSCLSLSRDKQVVRYSCSTHKSDSQSLPVGAIQANKPTPRNQAVYYFEVQVQNRGKDGKIAVGFAPAGTPATLARQPGWDPGSYAYHGDDGKLFNGDAAVGSSLSAYTPFGQDDTIGACLHLDQQSIFFTRNGRHLGVAFRNVRGVLFPTVGLHSKEECVSANFGQKPFLFDVQAFLKHVEATTTSEIAASPLNACHVLHSVQDYLRHYGYSDTLQAFEGEACLREEPGSSGGHGAPPPRHTRQREHPLSPPTSPEQLLQLRGALRAAIMEGQLERVFDALPALIASGGGGDAVWFDARFHLRCLKFGELCRTRRVTEAVDWARQELIPYQSGAGTGTGTGTNSEPSTSLSPEQALLLTDTLALVCYAEPEESQLSGLLSVARCECVADAVNDALLAAYGEGPRSCALQVALRQLSCVQDALHDAHDSQGRPFVLADHV